MLIAARLIAGGLGLFMLYFVLGGLLAYPVFYWPDLAMGALLALAAIMQPRAALVALPLAGAYALGVYAVAAANQAHTGGAVSVLLMASIAVAALATALSVMAAVRRG